MAKLIKNSLRAVETEELKKAVAKELLADDPQNAERILAQYYGTPERTEKGEGSHEDDDDSERNE